MKNSTPATTTVPAPTVNTSIRITDGLKDRIRRAAARSEMTRTDFIKKALEEAADKVLTSQK